MSLVTSSQLEILILNYRSRYVFMATNIMRLMLLSSFKYIEVDFLPVYLYQLGGHDR